MPLSENVINALLEGNNPGNIFEQAELAYDGGDYSASVKLYEHLLNAVVNDLPELTSDTELTLKIANSYFNLQNYASAKQFYSLFIEKVSVGEGVDRARVGNLVRQRVVQDADFDDEYLYLAEGGLNLRVLFHEEVKRAKSQIEVCDEKLAPNLQMFWQQPDLDEQEGARHQPNPRA